MHVGFFNLKGGVGKTALAVTMAKEAKFSIVTNEAGTRLKNCLPPTQFIKVAKGEPYPIIDRSLNIIWDFGGSHDPRTDPILPELDVVVVPIKFNNENDWGLSAISLSDILKHHSRIILAINMTDAVNLPTVYESLEISYPDIPYVVFPRNAKYLEDTVDNFLKIKEAGNYWRLHQSMWTLIDLIKKVGSRT